MQLKKGIYTGLISALVLLCCAGCERKQPQVVWESYTEQDESAAEEAGLVADGTETLQAQDVMETQPQKIFVDICGAVQRPGVYELEEGMRVCDAVEAAGGLLESASCGRGKDLCVYTGGSRAAGYFCFGAERDRRLFRAGEQRSGGEGKY